MTELSKLELQACFDCTDLSKIEALATNFSEFTDTLTSYVSFCEDMCMQTKTFCQGKEKTYRSGDQALHKQARKRLKREIRVV